MSINLWDIEKMDNFVKVNVDNDDDDHILPGFRFHPTDEELVGFYLRRKVDKRPISLELIKHIDIYKYDPWDLPKGNNPGEKEWFFFCRRGRKYRNSIRPNRVTASGFWKATGIDKPIYSDGRNECIGLKKSLVYYRGNAGKGTKTEWMMHEFRLPPLDYQHNNSNRIDHKTHLPDEFQKAEVWTICRIMKRDTPQRKCMVNMKEISSVCNTTFSHATSKPCRVLESVHGYDINFTNTSHYKPEQFFNLPNHAYELQNQLPMTTMSQPPSSAIISSLHSDFSSPEVGEFVPYGEWDELRCITEFAKDPFLC